MKRMHVHVSVEDLTKSIAFYSAMFDTEPSVIKDDYAKWMLDDPRINFAITPASGKAGVDHLGFQVESDTELSEMHSRLERAEINALKQSGAACCYSRSDKHWAQDPQGIAWETFHSLQSIPTFGADLNPAKAAPGASAESTAASSSQNACCTPGKANAA